MEKNKKIMFIFAFFLGVIVTLGAVTLMDAVDVSFNNAGTKISSTDVQGALEEVSDMCKVRNRICENVATPKLNNNLIPITLSNNGEVKYANVNRQWYDYCSKEWANAVMLVNEPSKTYKVNDTILENDIKAYFVWIPKYKYRLWNVGTTNASKGKHSIDIVFDTENTTNIDGVSCATPMTANNSGQCNDGEYMTHPAFISMNVNGFWVGKFEPTGAINAMTVKPGQVSVRNQTVKTYFESMYNYSRENNSHMMKNTEWGAVVYLSHSKYGIDTEININNNSDYKTGYSSLPTINQSTYTGIAGNTSAYNSPYNTEVGYLASTTGNITGIYDINGGAYECLAAYRANTYLNSGFNASSISAYDSKYFDVYPNNSAWNTHQYRILDDATGEMGPFTQKTVGSRSGLFNNWYTDGSHFVEQNYPWYNRGGMHVDGILSGQYLFYGHTGEAAGHISSRIVLSP